MPSKPYRVIGQQGRPGLSYLSSNYIGTYVEPDPTNYQPKLSYIKLPGYSVDIEGYIVLILRVILC